MTSISDLIPCLAAKSIISCVSFMPPMPLPATIFLPISKGKAGSSSGLSGAPTITSFPWDFNRSISGSRGCTADTVSIMPSIVPLAACISSGSRLARKESAPRRLIASSFLLGEVLITVTLAPKALPNLSAI
uniref:Uncharacterized protein n=1 Tax=Opuntia streptacantha TaxID=393608 RepID=A0A7C9DB75_OPUST